MPEKPSKPRRARILIVEDDDLMRAFYRSLFQRKADEFVCQFEKTGESALRFLSESQVEAVILDWDMPGISGIDLIKVLRRDHAHKTVRILMVSGRTAVDEQLLALHTGADEYLSKPIDVGVFLARLRKLLNR